MRTEEEPLPCPKCGSRRYVALLKNMVGCFGCDHNVTFERYEEEHRWTAARERADKEMVQVRRGLSTELRHRINEHNGRET